MRNANQGKDENQDKDIQLQGKKNLKHYGRVISDIEMETKWLVSHQEVNHLPRLLFLRNAVHLSLYLNVDKEMTLQMNNTLTFFPCPSSLSSSPLEPSPAMLEKSPLNIWREVKKQIRLTTATLKI